MRVEVFYDNGRMKALEAPRIETSWDPANLDILVLECYREEEVIQEEKENPSRLGRILEALTKKPEEQIEQPKPYHVALVNMRVATIVDFKENEEEL